ncbi:unnamed protein product [Boreogadus saida]
MTLMVHSDPQPAVPLPSHSPNPNPNLTLLPDGKQTAARLPEEPSEIHLNSKDCQVNLSSVTAWSFTPCTSLTDLTDRLCHRANLCFVGNKKSWEMLRKGEWVWVDSKIGVPIGARVKKADTNQCLLVDDEGKFSLEK